MLNLPKGNHRVLLISCLTNVQLSCQLKFLRLKFNTFFVVRLHVFINEVLLFEVQMLISLLLQLKPSIVFNVARHTRLFSAPNSLAVVVGGLRFVFRLIFLFTF